jgi:hypothetical protein
MPNKVEVRKDSTEEYGHPASLWPTRWFWHDRSDQSVEFQIMDIVSDIRSILWIWFLLWVIW